MNKNKIDSIVLEIKKQLQYENISFSHATNPNEVSEINIKDQVSGDNIYAYCSYDFSDVWLVGFGFWHGHYECAAKCNLVRVRRLIRGIIAGDLCHVECLDKDGKRWFTGIYFPYEIPETLSKNIVKLRRTIFGVKAIEEAVDFLNTMRLRICIGPGRLKENTKKIVREMI